MQKTLLKFIVFELMERIARFRLLVQSCDDELFESAPILKDTLKAEGMALEEAFFAQKSNLVRLFNENSGSSPTSTSTKADNLFAWGHSIQERLDSLSRLLCHFKSLKVEAETHLFLKDALPPELIRNSGEQSVFLSADRKTSVPAWHLLTSPEGGKRVFIDTLPVLQKSNPLDWVGLTEAYSRFRLEQTSVVEALKLDWAKSDSKKILREHSAGAVSGVSPTGSNASSTLAIGINENEWLEDLFCHALHLRLLGPAYYFYAVSQAAWGGQDAFFRQRIEPALFFGLNHQNFVHKSLVILHEACGRSKTAHSSSESKEDSSEGGQPLSEELLANLFRQVEKMIPEKFSFQEKSFDRSIQLRDRLSEGVLISSTPKYTLGEAEESLKKARAGHVFSIYEPLAMMTEYPHTPREIINAGWLYKMERSSLWLYTYLNETPLVAFEKLSALLNEQDQLLRKSIEVAEVHRVLAGAL